MTSGGSSDSHAFQVAPADIDHMGHVNNAVYLRWVQDAVTAFWSRTAPSQAVRSIAWVALKHEITYRPNAFLDQRIDVTTVAERLVGARAFFLASIQHGGTVLAEVKSTWCSVDASSLRPVRLAKEIERLFFVQSGAPA